MDDGDGDDSDSDSDSDGAEHGGHGGKSTAMRAPL